MRYSLLLLLATKCTYAFRGPALAPLATPPRSHSIIAPRAAAVAIEADADAPLPRALLPVTLSVFAQMIGEGIAIATLPLHLTRLGAKPVEVALATSFFSVAQMVCCPLLVRRSGGAGGRGQTLCLCLAGATLGNVGIAMSPSVAAIVVCRFLCGAFAASVPVAQAAATELVAPAQAPAALARVAASSQMAVVVGPSCAALLMSAFAAAGVPQAFRLRAVFLTASVFAAGVLGVLARSFQATAAKAQAIASQDEPALKVEQKQVAPTKPAPGILPGVSAQFALRSIALVVGWSLTLSVYCYGLFAPKFMGYDQPQLSATFSAGALTTIAAQVLFPTLVRRIGPHLTSCFGLLTLSLGMASQSIVRSQPLHSLFYLINRAGAGISDTSTATLVARTSPTPDARAKNLALIQSRPVWKSTSVASTRRFRTHRKILISAQVDAGRGADLHARRLGLALRGVLRLPPLPGRAALPDERGVRFACGADPPPAPAGRAEG